MAKRFIDTEMFCDEYGINDRDINELLVKKTVVKKGDEFIFFYFY